MRTPFVVYRFREAHREYLGVNRLLSLLYRIIERLERMPTSQDLSAAVATLKQMVGAAITAETAAIEAAIATAAANGTIPQSLVDSVNAATGNIKDQIGAMLTPSVSVSPTSITGAVGDVPPALSATANDGSAITFTSGDASIATVDATGNVTLVATGTTVITCTAANGGTASVSVTVA